MFESVCATDVFFEVYPDAGHFETYERAYRDPEFYEFYRSINAYANVFSNKGDMLVLDPNSDFFKYLKKSGDGS